MLMRSNGGSSIESTADTMDLIEAAESCSDNDDAKVERLTGAKKLARARACVGCRNSKIKCIYVAGQSACQACQRGSRDCVLPGPAKQRTRTAHKVAELEKRIQMLTDALLAKEEHGTSITASSIATRQASSTHANHKVLGSLELPNQQDMSNTSIANPSVLHHSRRLDLIDRGVIQLDLANILLEHWKQTQNIRYSMPMVFIAILAVASASIRPSLQPQMLLELNEQLAERVLITGEKSMDLVKALLLYTTHFTVPAQAERSSYTQYVHSIISVSLDLGLDKGHRPIQPHIEANDVRRTWLACYFTASSVATLFRHTPLVRFSRHTEQCRQQLLVNENNPSDVWLCHLVSLRQITEEASLVFELDDSASTVTFSDAKSQFQLASLDQQLKSWRDSAPKLVHDGVLNHTTATATLFIHSLAIRSYEQNRNAGKVGSLINSAAHFEALRICLEASHTIINQYLSFSVTVARCLPILIPLWTVYATVMLIKLSHYIETTSMLRGPVESTAHLLDSMLARLAELSSDGYWPQAKEFHVLFERLRAWYLYRQAACQFGDPSCNLVGALHSAIAESETSYKERSDALPVNAGIHGPRGEHITSSTNGDTSGTLGATYDGVNQENINWGSFGFDVNDLNAFDFNMQNDRWMSYLYEQQPVVGGGLVQNAGAFN